MRSVATVGAVIVAAFLLGGCPAPDYQTEPAPAAPISQDTDASLPAPPDVGPGRNDSEPAQDTTADDAAGGDTPANDTTGDDATGGDTNEQPPLPDVMQIPQGIYVGTVTITEIAHCSGLYAAAAGAEVQNVTEWPNYGVTVDAEGLPNLENQTVDLVGIRIVYTFSDLQRTTDGVTTNWLAQIEFVDPATGLSYFSMPGTETNVYRLTESGSLQIDFLLEGHVADQFGTVTYQVTMIGELIM